MSEPFTAEQRAILNVMGRSMKARVIHLQNSLHRTRRDLIALAVLLSQRGVEIDPDEWEAAGREIEAAHQVESVFDPRATRGEELFDRLMRGEDVEDVEKDIDDWLRDAEDERGA